MYSRRRSHSLAAPLAALCLIASFFLFSPIAAQAQTTNAPRFLLTWKATNSYIPPFYQGKALVSYGSNITAALEVVLPNGTLANLSNQPIFWYVDGTVVGGGTGVQEVTFPPFGTPPSILSLTVSLPQYPGGVREVKTNIPFVNPVAVIGAPYPNQQFSTSPVSVTAYPFFFNTTSPSDLSYSWAVNGQTGTSAENPEIADVSLPQGTPSGTSIDISLTIQGTAASTIAVANQTLTYQSQL